MRNIIKVILLTLLLSSTLTAEEKKGIIIPYIDFPMKKGEGMYSTKGKCNMCHSFGYIINQGKQSKKFWHDKVIKMIVVFKAPIKTQKDIDTVSNYLFENYGNGKVE
ncbi:Cytochrome c551/c552 [hydrothermal vent metagenome]|uniref:Cytochrome c551/c552 n=1 Tax=hydrothermal vent metagenome TaxID=652676 RepID=A0A1W1ECN7_9ZZZZ